MIIGGQGDALGYVIEFTNVFYIKKKYNGIYK